MVPVLDRPPGANRLARWVNHLPRFKNQVQSVLAPMDEEHFDQVTFKDQHRPHALEHVVVPPPVSMVQSQRENQSQQNPLGEDTLFEPSSNGITNSSRQPPQNVNGHLPSSGGGGGGSSNTSGLLIHVTCLIGIRIYDLTEGHQS